jgi:hypothetical protein
LTEFAKFCHEKNLFIKKNNIENEDKINNGSQILKSTPKDANNSKENKEQISPFLEIFNKLTFLEDFDLVESILYNKDELIKFLVENEKIEDLLYFTSSPGFFNLHELIFNLKYMKKSELNSNYFRELFEKNNYIPEFDFKELFKKIFQSECIKSYYDECEVWDNYKDSDKSELQKGNIFERFYERIIYVPLPYFYNGFTDATLFTFIRSGIRKIYHKKETFHLKFLVLIFLNF